MADQLVAPPGEIEEILARLVAAGVAQPAALATLLGVEEEQLGRPLRVLRRVGLVAEEPGGALRVAALGAARLRLADQSISGDAQVRVDLPALQPLPPALEPAPRAAHENAEEAATPRRFAVRAPRLAGLMPTDALAVLIRAKAAPADGAPVHPGAKAAPADGPPVQTAAKAAPADGDPVQTAAVRVPGLAARVQTIRLSVPRFAPRTPSTLLRRLAPRLLDRRVPVLGAMAMVVALVGHLGVYSLGRVGAAPSLNAAVLAPPTPFALALPPAPTSAPTAAPERWMVVDHTNGLGLVLRPEPASSARVLLLQEGSRLRVTGTSVEQSGHQWLPVTSATGATGWVAGEFLAPEH